MCHQSIGLIARALEEAGIPTMSLTSAWSITAAVNPPRAAFVDYPLGHTTGQPHDRAGQRALLQTAMAAMADSTEAGTIIDLGLDWGEQSWRADPLRGASRTAADRPEDTTPGSESGSDTRVERFDTPQYQNEQDRRAAELRHGDVVACLACVGFDD